MIVTKKLVIITAFKINNLNQWVRFISKTQVKNSRIKNNHYIITNRIKVYLVKNNLFNHKNDIVLTENQIKKYLQTINKQTIKHQPHVKTNKETLINKFNNQLF